MKNGVIDLMMFSETESKFHGVKNTRRQAN